MNKNRINDFSLLIINVCIFLSFLVIGIGLIDNHLSKENPTIYDYSQEVYELDTLKQ